MSAPDVIETFAFNGVDGASGTYLYADAALGAVARLAAGTMIAPPERSNNALKRQQAEPDYGVRFGVDPENLSAAGWGLLVGTGVPHQYVSALAGLCRVRESQARRRYRVFDGPDAPYADESGLQWLARHGMGPGPANPEKVPYYLLLVGTPEQISFRFQHDLDVQYAVGRLDLPDAAAYEAYAASVVAAEEDEPRVDKRLALFGPRNRGDRATALSTRQLLKPLESELSAAATAWTVESHLGDLARKQRLVELIGDADAPSVLVTASHGLGFPSGHPRQRAEQGALLCQDWPGPLDWRGEIPAAHCFAAADVPPRVRARLVFAFACFGGGTPAHDEFAALDTGAPHRIAEAPFSARLPSELLRAGALNVIGHVDRVWGCSFSWPQVGPQIDAFSDVLQAVMAGYRVGHALEPFDLRYAQLADALSQTLSDHRRFGASVDSAELTRTWVAAQDARSYVLLGDPAVRVVALAE